MPIHGSRTPGTTHAVDRRDRRLRCDAHMCARTRRAFEGPDVVCSAREGRQRTLTVSLISTELLRGESEEGFAIELDMHAPR
jgi:hypothetical protein